MDYRASTTPRDLESMLFDESIEPKALPLSLLEHITNGFSNDHEIGRGGFGVVYKGILENANVAVKKLSNAYMYEEEFYRELESLMKVKHKNIVRFLGYCVDTQGRAESYNGKFVMVDVHQRLLCFEYLPNGSLADYITDSSAGLEWRMRYKIIKGICEGLNYLHRNHIVHFDLKPANILMDENMVPKISDFGLSMCFQDKGTQVLLTEMGGTIGYLAPEFFASGRITSKFDLYSLGVIIIEILTGKKGYEEVQNVLESWSNRSHISQREQLRVCTEIGIQCSNFNPAKRPDSEDIINRLEKAEPMQVIPESGL
jgi:serine/threonine protein kinase